ncbi:MAG TPA: hypothetical protein VK966_11780 [Longimicrobiales bacterium]|nr:hypothetical protein [Longimicrobiales bacterium]
MLAILGCALTVATAAAQELPPGPQGAPPAADYEFVPVESESIDDAIDEAVAHMNFIVRRIARGRLEGANQPIDLIELRYPADSVWIRLRRHEPPIITPQSGEFTDYTRADGETVQVRTRLGQGVIEQWFEAEDGRKGMTYRLRPDGSLALEVEVHSDRLREPLTYTWVYRRVE